MAGQTLYVLVSLNKQELGVAVIDLKTMTMTKTVAEATPDDAVNGLLWDETTKTLFGVAQASLTTLSLHTLACRESARADADGSPRPPLEQKGGRGNPSVTSWCGSLLRCPLLLLTCTFLMTSASRSRARPLARPGLSCGGWTLLLAPGPRQPSRHST